MHPMLHTKVVPIVFPTAISDNASPTTTEIDRDGFDYCTIYLRIGATDIAMAACKVQESDTSGSNFVDIAGTDLNSGTTDIEGNTLALPSATADNTFVVIHLDCRGRKRYLDLVLTSGNGTAGSWLYAFAILSRAKQAPVTNVGCAGTGGKVVAI